MARSRPTLTILLIISIAALLMASCVIINDNPRHPTSAPDEGSSMTLTDPAEILALAGLELPPGAHNIRVTTKPNLIDKGYIYAYTVTWDGTVETTIAFLATIGYDLNLLGPRDDSDLEIES